MSEDLYAVLMRFHREVTLPDIERIVEKLDLKWSSWRDECLSHFDAIYKRFDRLEMEYQSIKEGLRRLEEAFAEQKIEREAVRAELQELKVHVAQLQERIAVLEAQIEAVSSPESPRHRVGGAHTEP